MSIDSILDQLRWPKDDAILWLLHAVLIGFLFVAVVKSIALSFERSPVSVVTRGDLSMGRLGAMFAAVSGLFLFAIDVSDAAVGYKSSLVVLDFSALVYLFFFNVWFRNGVIGAISERHYEHR